MAFSSVVTRRLGTSLAMAVGLGLVATPSAAQGGRLRVFGVGVPSGATARWGTRSSVVFNVRVRNDSTVAAPGLIRVELEGVATSSSSPITALPPGVVTLIPVSVDVDLTRIPNGGDAIRFSAILLNARREGVDRFAGTLAVIPVAAGPPAMMPNLDRPDLMRFSRDLAIEQVIYADPRGPRGPGFIVVVKNRGRERWAYTGSIGSQVGLGTPASHVEWSSQLILQPAALPRGLAPGESAMVWLGFQPVTTSTPVSGGVKIVPNLPTELWITVHVFVASSYDVNRSNDALFFVFRLNGDRRVAESRTTQAPGLTVRVGPE